MPDVVATPMVKILLITIIFLAVFIEIKTAGLGLGAFVGLIATMVFFSNQWMIGMAGWLEAILFLTGILFIVIELYTPGIGFFAIAGISTVLASLVLALGADLAAIHILMVSLFISLFLFIIIAKRLPSSSLWNKLILRESETTQAGFVSGQNYSSFLGKEGIVVTRLRPAGIIDIDGNQLDVVSEGRYIEQGSKVRIVYVSGTRIVVRPVITNFERS